METAIALFIIVLFEVGGVLAITIWGKVLEWIIDSLFIWIRDTLPKIARFSSDTVKLAFTFIKGASEGLRKAVKEAWKALKPYLSELKMKFQEDGSNWFRVIRSAIINFDNITKQPIRVTTEVTEEIGFEEMPAEMREAIIRGSRKNLEVDIKEGRNRELLEMTN